MTNEQGLEFLKSTEAGQRLLVAEEALRLIEAGHLEHLKRAVTDAVFVARAMNDPGPFDGSSSEAADSRKLKESSEVTAYLMMNLLGVPQATLFYSRATGVAESQLFGAYFPSIIQLIYSAIGLDVKQAAEIDEETLSKLTTAGIPRPK